jgi:NhaP-type Na+/H+ or K+/H+ antiporter
MPLTIAAAAGLAAWWLGFDPAAAVLFGAVLAPTDPVLAADVQIPSPDDDDEHGDVQFSLTSEAGLNDALAFPFTLLAIAMLERGSSPSGWWVDWLTVDVAYRLSVGIVGGLVTGWLLSRLVFRIPVGDMPLAETGEGLVALVGTFLTYGLVEMAEGYGFLAVFVAAVVMRQSEKHHDYHEVVHDFAEQTERLVNGVILVLFGAALAEGLLAEATWPMLGVVAAILLVVRPVSAAIALGGVSEHRWLTAFFGIRGVGSLFYLAYALEGHDFGINEELWSAVGLTVLCSIVLHGLSAGPAMQHYEESDPGGRPEREDEAVSAAR